MFCFLPFMEFRLRDCIKIDTSKENHPIIGSAHSQLNFKIYNKMKKRFFFIILFMSISIMNSQSVIGAFKSQEKDISYFDSNDNLKNKISLKEESLLIIQDNEYYNIISQKGERLIFKIDESSYSGQIKDNDGKVMADGWGLVFDSTIVSDYKKGQEITLVIYKGEGENNLIFFTTHIGNEFTSYFKTIWVDPNQFKD